MTVEPISIHPVSGIGEVVADADLAELIRNAADRLGNPLREHDCIVVTQKIVSKAEGRLVEMGEEPGAKRALVESESVRVLRRRGDLMITETHHGFICANSGIDLSNVPDGWAALLPVDPDRSARRIRDAVRAALDIQVGVVISDTFGRPWRIGLTDVAIGVAGIAAVIDLRDTPDAHGRNLDVTEVAVADEIAASAELAMGKARNIPVAIVRGLPREWFRESSSRELIRPSQEDLFR